MKYLKILGFLIANQFDIIISNAIKYVFGSFFIFFLVAEIYANDNQSWDPNRFKWLAINKYWVEEKLVPRLGHMLIQMSFLTSN